MLAAPALAAAGGEFGLQHRGRVGKCAVAQRPQVCGQFVAQLLQAPAHHLVVIPPPGVERHGAGGSVVQTVKFEGLPALGRAARQVVHAGGDHAQGAGHQLCGAGALEAVALHIVHVAIKALSQPGQQTGLGGRQIHTGHANLGESQLLPPLLQLRLQASRCSRAYFWSASLRVMDVHPAIVKTPALALLWADEAATEAFAARLARQPGITHAFIALHGDLGAGKTTLVRHLLRALGVEGRVKSPTYAVVEPYELPNLNIWHFDFYRFGDAREWEDAGFRDIFASPGLKLAEWPEKAAQVLPVIDLDITLSTLADGARRVTLVANTPAGAGLLQGLDDEERGP